MRIVFNEISWNDYQYWLQNDKKVLKKINELIKDIKRTPFDGLGKPESLKYDLSGLWSRRIDKEHRLVYNIDDNSIFIYSCRFHYDK